MKKLVLIILAMFSNFSYAVDFIPDPTVGLESNAPKGLPNLEATTINIERKFGTIQIQGVLITDSNIFSKKNKVYIDNGYYSVDEIINDEWKVKSIARKKVVLSGLKGKEVKSFNISGE